MSIPRVYLLKGKWLFYFFYGTHAIILRCARKDTGDGVQWSTHQAVETTMNIQICPGRDEHIEGCIESIKHSVLWDMYFQYIMQLDALFKKGIGKNQVHVALNTAGRCIGFIWVDKYGAFSHFPYLRSFAVHRQYRNKHRLPRLRTGKIGQ